MKTPIALLATATAATVLLTGCGSNTESATAPATPTHIQTPKDQDSCTVTLLDGHTSEAKVTCGNSETTVKGDFRNKVTNEYDPADTSGITRILFVGKEGRAWVNSGNGTCFIAYHEDSDPVACRMPEPNDQNPDGREVTREPKSPDHDA